MYLLFAMFFHNKIHDKSDKNVFFGVYLNYAFSITFFRPIKQTY